MNCDTCEKLRVDASEDPGVHEHMSQCASCQSFSLAVQTMDRELPQMWTPPLPSDFSARVAAQARARGALRPRPWYQRWLEGEDAATARDAVRRALGFGGLVGGLVGGMAVVAMYTRYCSVNSYSENGHYDGHLHGVFTLLKASKQVYEAFVPLSLWMMALAAALVLVAARPLKLWAGTPRLSPLRIVQTGGALLSVLGAACAAQTLGLFTPRGYWAGAAPYVSTEALPMGLLLLGGWLIVLVVVVLLMTRGVSGAPAQAVVFYGGSAMLYGLFRVWDAWTSVSIVLDRPVDNAVFLLSPVVVLGWAGLTFGLIAAGGVAWLVLLREHAPARGAVVVLVAGGAALVAGCLWSRTPAPLALSAGPQQTNVLVACPGGSMRQETLTFTHWDTPENVQKLERLAHGPIGPERQRSTQDLMQIAYLQKNEPLMRQIAEQEVSDAAGLAGIWDWTRGSLSLLPNREGQDVARQHVPSQDIRWPSVMVEGQVQIDDRPAPGVEVRLCYFPTNFTPPTWDELFHQSSSLIEEVDERLRKGNFYDPDVWLGGEQHWVVSDAAGHFALPADPKTRYRLMLTLPGMSSISRCANLPEMVAIPADGAVDLGAIKLWR